MSRGFQETLFWLSQPSIEEDITQGRAEHAAGETMGEAEGRARYGLPKQA